MKKSLIFLFALALVFVLLACSEQEESNITSNVSSPSEESDINETSAEESIEYEIKYIEDDQGVIIRKEENDPRVRPWDDSVSEKLTLEKLLALIEEKGSSLSWDDFAEFIGDIDVDYETYEYVDDDGIPTVRNTLKSVEWTYKINDEMRLNIFGENEKVSPIYMVLTYVDEETKKLYRYDVRNGALEEFFETGAEFSEKGESIDFECVEIFTSPDTTAFEKHKNRINDNAIIGYPTIAVKTSSELNEVINLFSKTEELDSLKTIDFNKYSLLITVCPESPPQIKYIVTDVRKDGNMLYMDFQENINYSNWVLCPRIAVTTVEKSALDGIESVHPYLRWHKNYDEKLEYIFVPYTK